MLFDPASNTLRRATAGGSPFLKRGVINLNISFALMHWGDWQLLVCSENSVAISKIDYEIFVVDAQLELLTLYEMYKND